MRPGPKPTHYETLGLTPASTPQEIRRRFRELARRYHPDVARTPDANQRFLEINEAHSILSDPSKRATYDAHLKLTQPRETTGDRQRAKDDGRRPTGDQRPTTNDPRRTNDVGSRTPNGEHRTPAPEHPQRNPQSGARGARTPNTDRAAQCVAEARRAMGRLRYREAELLCRQANRLRRTSEAYEILGDVYRARGRTDDAVAMYSYALQLDRVNRSVQEKFDRIVGQPSGPTMAGRAARAERFPPAARAQAPPGLPAPTLRARAPITLLGAVIICVLLAAVKVSRNPPAGTVNVLEWDPVLVFALVLAGGVAGFLSAMNGMLGRARDELLGRARSGLPAGPVLVIFSLVFFYAAVVILAVLALVQERFPRSIVRAFAEAFGVIVLFALVSPISRPWILLAGGNLALPAFVAGWMVGDAARR